jgi:hypothetical protein
MKNNLEIFAQKKVEGIDFEMSDDQVFDSEDVFQYQALRWASDRYRELRQWGMFSYPAGGKRGKVQGMIMQSTGQKSGLPDLFFFLRNDFIFFIELKLKGKKPKPIQLECHDYLRRIGFRVYTIDNPKEFKRVITLEMENFKKLANG